MNKTNDTIRFGFNIFNLNLNICNKYDKGFIDHTYQSLLFPFRNGSSVHQDLRKTDLTSSGSLKKQRSSGWRTPSSLR